MSWRSTYNRVSAYLECSILFHEIVVVVSVDLGVNTLGLVLALALTNI